MADLDVEAADDRVLLELVQQRVAAGPARLRERIADGVAVLTAIGAVPVAAHLVVANAALHLENQNAQVRARHEVGLAVAGGLPCGLR